MWCNPCTAAHIVLYANTEAFNHRSQLSCTPGPGQTRGFYQGGGKIFKALQEAAHTIFFAPSVSGQSYNRGGKHLLPSFIMISLSLLFWHFIFSKTVSPNKHAGIK